MARVVITDAGPLIALAKIDHLGILEGLFGRLVLPRAVMQECLAKETEDSLRIKQAMDDGILPVQSPAADRPALPRSLGDGEKEAIWLALQHENALLILDDQPARKLAAKLGLNFVGTVRLLDIAERQGLIAGAAKAVASIRERGYRISSDILKQLWN